MKPCLGVAIGEDAVRAVLVSGTALRWHSNVSHAGGDGVTDAVCALLSDVPRYGRRARVTVVVSPAWAQVKPLAGLPVVKPARVARELLHQNAESFFLTTGRRHTIVGIHVEPDGTPWGASFDTEVLDGIVRGVRSARLRLTRVLPVAVALSAIEPNDAIAWRDGDEIYRLDGGRHGLARPRRCVEPMNCGRHVPAAIESIGDDAPMYVVAYSAAIAPRRLPLVWCPGADPRTARRWIVAGRVAACAAMCGAGAFASLAPVIRTVGSSRELDRQLAALRPAQAEIQRNELELARISGTLDRIAAFSAHRGDVTRLVATLSRATPESTALLTVRIDSIEGLFTAIAPRVTDVLPRLAAENDIVAPRIVGSITREAVGGVELERAAFRFRRRAAPVRR